MTVRTKSLHFGCLTAILLSILLGMMAGLIGLTSQLSRRVYTPQQQQWLSENSRLQLSQLSPEVNYLGVRDSVSSVAPAKAVAMGARESHVTADIDVRYKDYEGATVTAYDLRFAATYLVANPDPQQAISLEMNFPFPQTAAVLSEVTFAVDGNEPAGVTYSMQGVYWKAVIDPGQERKIEVRYRAEGVGSFGYGVPPSQRMRDFDLRVTIRGAQEINVPESALAPTTREDAADKTVLSWRYLNTITNRNVQVELPTRPRLAFAQRIEQLEQFFAQLALAAPLLTVLFLLLWLAATRLEALRVAYEHTLLLGIGFFLFYPLFIFLAGTVDVSLAFAISLVLAGALVVGYGVRVAGGRLVAIYLIPLLIVFYGLLTRGLTSPRYLGIMLTISGVLLVALFMWRVSRHKLLTAANAALAEEGDVMPAPDVAAVGEEETAAPDGRMEEAMSVQEGKDVSNCHTKNMERYCIHCGQCVEGSFNFCPQCGQGAQATRRCAKCGLEYIPTETSPSFCPACGEKQ
jgi:hypothetical protein